MLGHKELENEFHHFQEMFDTKARKDDTRKEFFEIIRQIHARRNDILSSGQNPDFYEQQGFSYSESTFDDLFVKKFKDIVDVATESSDEDAEPD